MITEFETGKVFEIEVERLSALEGEPPGKCNACHKDIQELPFLWFILYTGLSPSVDVFIHCECREDYVQRSKFIHFNFN
jgi:hypothetical protein